MSAAESGLVIPQPHAVIEERLLIPGHREDRFSRVTQLALQGGNVLPPHIVAAVTLTDHDHSEDAMARQAVELAEAEDYLREHPGEPFINASRASFIAGLAADCDALTVFNWSSPINEATGLAIPSDANVEIGFSPHRVQSVKAENPSDKPAKVITPAAAVTSETAEDRAFALVETAQKDGILVVGTRAVTAFVEEVSRLPHRVGNTTFKKAIRIAMPILELERE